MTYAYILPQTASITGADLTGSSGDTDRTYTISDSNLIGSGYDIIVNGASLHEGASLDFSVSSGVITFKNIVDDSDYIRITYYVGVDQPTSDLSNSSLKYATTTMLADILGIRNPIPSWDVAGTPSNENVGTGNDSDTIFYLDHKNILANSYTLYYGSDNTTTDTLTETTHYSLDLETGTITLTSAGVTLLSTSNIYAKYSYVSNGMSDSYLSSVIGRAEDEVDKAVNTTFTDGSSANPAYPVETEYQSSEGLWQDRIIVKKKPLIDITSTLDGTITSSDSSLSVAAGDGDKFPTSGYIILGSEVISYTGISTDTLTGLTRGALGTTAAAHTDGDDIHTTILFRSDTAEGTSVSWTVQAWETDMVADANGLIYKFLDASPNNLTRTGVAKRIQIIYYHGEDTIPRDITRLTLLFAKRALIQDNIGKAMIAGRNEFRPEMFEVDNPEIQRIIDSHIVLPMGNT